MHPKDAVSLKRPSLFVPIHMMGVVNCSIEQARLTTYFPISEASLESVTTAACLNTFEDDWLSIVL